VSKKCKELQVPELFKASKIDLISNKKKLFQLKSIHFWNSVFWLYENKVVQLMSARANLERFGEKYLVFIKWRLCKNCFKNEWTLAKKLMRSLEQFIWKSKGQNNLWNRMLFNLLLEVLVRFFTLEQSKCQLEQIF